MTIGTTRGRFTLLCGRVLAFVACSAAMLGGAQASKADTEDTGLWLAVSANGRLPQSMNNETGSWRFWLDAALRFGDDASRLSQGIMRAGAGCSLTDAWSLWGGYAYIRTDAPYATVPTNEQRIWQQVIWNGRIAQTQVSSRTRLEQRSFGTGSDTGWRFRELVKLTQPLDTTNTWSMVVSDEIFVNLNNATFTANSAATAGLDRNRFFVGPGVNLNRSVRTEFGYLYQYTFRHNGPDKNDHILSANVIVNF